MNKISLFFLAGIVIFSANVFSQQGGDSSHVDGSIDITSYETLKKGALTFSLNGSANNSKHIAGWSLTPQAWLSGSRSPGCRPPNVYRQSIFQAGF